MRTNKFAGRLFCVHADFASKDRSIILHFSFTGPAFDLFHKLGGRLGQRLISRILEMFKDPIHSKLSSRCVLGLDQPISDQKEPVAGSQIDDALLVGHSWDQSYRKAAGAEVPRLPAPRHDYRP